MKRLTLSRLRVRASIRDPRRGTLLAGPQAIPCALGRGGIGTTKREGDGRTPRGSFRLRGGGYRPDRFGTRPRSPLDLVPLRSQDGWCDDVRDRRYNRPVSLPCAGVSTERMWRDDRLYDLVIDLDYNRFPIRRGRGSAIFLHCARPGYTPTEGCVALAFADLRRLLPRLGRNTRIVVR